MRIQCRAIVFIQLYLRLFIEASTSRNSKSVKVNSSLPSRNTLINPTKVTSSIYKSSKKLTNSSSIINGYNAGLDEFNYIVSFRKIHSLLNHYGAGVIIHPQWILTVRHNVIKEWKHNASTYFNFTKIFPFVVYPKYDNDLENYWYKHYWEPDKSFCHPPPDDKPAFVTDADIALVKLKYPIPLGPNNPYNWEMVPVITNYFDVNWAQRIAFAGWGRYRRDLQEPARYLQKAFIRTKPSSACVRPSGGFRPLQQICVYDDVQFLCQGDSGGPGILLDKRTSAEVLVGIISYSNKDCTYFGYLQNVYHFRKWIDHIMNEEDETYYCSNLIGKSFNG